MVYLDEKDLKVLRRAETYQHVGFVKMKVVKEKEYHYHAGNQLKTPEDIAKYIDPVFKGLDREQIICVNLDTAMVPTAIDVVAIGNVNRCVADIANCYKHAIISNAASIVIAHNHVSGNISPSNEDMDFTRKIVEVGKLIGIPVLDHLIIGDTGYYSFSENGQI